MDISEIKNYFKKTNSKNTFFIDILNSTYKGPFYTKSTEFGNSKHKIRIIDQFSGKTPILWNHKFCSEGKSITLNPIYSFIMDSHLVTGLHEYVTNKDSLRLDIKDAIEKFLIHTSETGFDFNPSFYLMESCCKNSEEEFMEYASLVMSSIFKLHSMDKKKFIKNREISLKKDAINNYFDKYKGSSLEECAKNKIMQSCIPKTKKRFNFFVDLSYASLLKMVLINYYDQKGTCKKTEKFEQFMIDNFGFRLDRENHIAIYYFSGFADKFVNTQPAMKRDNALRDLRATAWDISLLRYSEGNLAPMHLPNIMLAYVVTSEKQLFELGKLFTVEYMVYRISADNYECIPAISFDLEGLVEKLGDKAILKLLKRNETISIDRILNNKPSLISTSNLKCLIHDLEIQMSNLCRG